MASQDVECLENVNAFVLEVDDVAYIANHFGRLLRTPRIQGILRFCFDSNMMNRSYLPQ